MAGVDSDDLNVDELNDGTHTGDYGWDVGEEAEELFWTASEDDPVYLAKYIYQYDYHPDTAGANPNLVSKRLPDKVLEEVMEMGMPEVTEEDLDYDARAEVYTNYEDRGYTTITTCYDDDPDEYKLKEALDKETKARRERFLSSRYDPRPTPLLKALHVNSRECVKMLLDAGADANACPMVQGKRLVPLTEAHSVACAALLIGAGAVVEKELVRAAIMGPNRQYLRLLLANVQALGPAAYYQAAVKLLRGQDPATGGEWPARRAKEVINRESRWRRRRALVLAREHRVAARDAGAGEGDAEGGGVVKKTKKETSKRKVADQKVAKQAASKKVAKGRKAKQAAAQPTKKRTLRRRR